MFSRLCICSALLASAFVPLRGAIAQPPEPDVQFLFDGDLNSRDGVHMGAAVGDSVGFNNQTPFAYSGNQSLELGGTDDQVSVASLIGSMNGNSSVSIAMWVRNRASIGNDRPFLGLDPPSNGDDGGARYDDSGASGGGNNVLKLSLPGVGNYETAPNQQKVDEWQHVAMVFDGTDLSVYIDGVLDTPTDDNISPGSIAGQTQFLIGNGPKGPGASWDGFIDELAVWNNVALTADEILFLSQNSLLAVPEPTSAGLWIIAMVGLSCFGWRRLRRETGN